MSQAIKAVYDELLSHLIIEDMSVYHSKTSEYLSSGKLKLFRDESPALYEADLNGDLPEFDTAAFAQGRSAHTLILEGEAEYADTYKVGGPINEKTGQPYGRTTKKFAEWCIEENVDPSFVLTVSDHLLNLEERGFFCVRKCNKVRIIGGVDR